MKSATNRVAGRSYSSSGVAELLDLARVHDRDPVAHRERLFLVVGHVHERDADLGLDALELDLELAAELEVEGARAARRGAARVGRLTRARARATRCCWPPESWLGLRRS